MTRIGQTMAVKLAVKTPRAFKRKSKPSKSKKMAIAGWQWHSFPPVCIG